MVDEYMIEGQDFFNTTLKSMTEGKFNLNPTDIINSFFDIVMFEINSCKKLLGVILIIGALSALTSLLENSLGRRGSANAAFYAVFTMISCVCVEYFGIALNYTRDVIGLLSVFITKLSPILSTLMILSGKVASASVFHPVLATSVYVVTFIIEKCIIPLVTYSLVLGVVNNMTTELSVSGMVRLINSITKWILTAAFTLFSGICGIYGFSAPALDAMSTRTMKFAAGTLVPVVGNFLSETLDTILGSGAVMKNVVGSAGIVAMCVICAVPVIKLGVLIIMIKISGAILEPLADKRISKLLNECSSAVTLLFASVITVAILFMICVGIMISSTG